MCFAYRFLRLLTVASLLLSGFLSNAWAVGAADFVKPYAGVKSVRGSLPLLVVLLRTSDPRDATTKSQAQIRQIIFGPRKSVTHYFNEVSYGNFSFKEAFTTPWLVAQDDPATSGLDESTYDFLHRSDIYKKGAWLIRQVEQMTNFRFSRYDRNRDGKVTINELAVLWIYPGGIGRGRRTDPPLVKVPSLSRGVELGLLARTGDREDWAVSAHELAHQVMKLSDLYVGATPSYPGVGRFSLMCDSQNGPHLDPWAKIKLGWLHPTVVTEDGWYSLLDVERNSQALILRDATRGSKEYFIVENRWPTGTYDDVQGTPGLAVWRINERHDNPNVDWGRRTIELLWAAGPPPVAQRQRDTCPTAGAALFDGSRIQAAYALTPASNPARLTWKDGSPSGFAIWHVPEAGPLARFYIDVPPLSDPNLVATAVTSKGSTRDLDRNGAVTPYALPPGLAPHDIVGMSIASDNHVYAWYRNGTVSAGTRSNLAYYRPPQPYSLPGGRVPNDILAIGIARDDHVYAWYRDGKVSAGTSRDLDKYRSPYGFVLPPGWTPRDIVGIGIARDNHVYAWYRDGMVSAGTTSDFDVYRSPYRYSLPFGRVPGDVVGMGIDNRDHSHVWLVQRGSGVAPAGPLQIGVHAHPGAVTTGKVVRLMVKVSDRRGRPLSGARVGLHCDRGRFVSSGNLGFIGTSDSLGWVRADWRAPNFTSATYQGRILFEVQATRPGFNPGLAITEVPLLGAPIR